MPSTRPTPPRGFLLTMREGMAPAVTTPPPPPVSLAGDTTRGAVLLALATYGDAGAHAETLAVRLWREAPGVWGMKRYPEHPNPSLVMGRLADLRARGFVEACEGGVRLTLAGRKAARATAAAARKAA